MALNEKDPVGDALQNSLILNRIFSFLPTKSLLDDASLVNKFWCEESRKFMRDYRKCTARIQSRPVVPLVMSLLKFDIHLLGMKTTVPYNGIHFYMAKSEAMKSYGFPCYFSPVFSDSDLCHFEGEYTTLCQFIRTGKMKLKYLSIDLEPVDCPGCTRHCMSVAKVLNAVSDQIEHVNLVQCDPIINVDPTLTLGSVIFTKLQILEINSKTFKSNPVLFNKIISSAPNLKILNYDSNHDSMEMFKVLPPDKLHLLKKLSLRCGNTTREEMEMIYKKLCCVSPAVEEMSALFPVTIRFQELGPIFLAVFRKLLESSQKSLERMVILIFGNGRQDSTLVESVPAVRFSKMSRLTITGTQLDVCSTVRGIDFDRMFPSLKGITLAAKQNFVFRGENDVDMGLMVPERAFYSSTTVAALVLNLDSYGNTSFNQLRQMFPAVTSLCVRSLSPGNMIILWQVIRLWPGLKEIALHGKSRGVWTNYDYQFCGTSREEMEYLWEQDNAFLTKVHIVPIRPCLSTLPKLSRVDIEVKSNLGPTPENLRRENLFVSEVTKLVVFKRLPFLRASVKLDYTGTGTVTHNQGGRPIIYEYSPGTIDL